MSTGEYIVAKEWNFTEGSRYVHQTDPRTPHRALCGVVAGTGYHHAHEAPAGLLACPTCAVTRDRRAAL